MLTAHHKFQTINNVQQAIDLGDTTVKAIVAAHFEAIEELDPVINAYTAINTNALNDADELDRVDVKQRGPLFGVPIAIKDQIETAGIPTAFGSIACKDYVPDKDATLVRKLREAGAIILGKTTTPDWAGSWFSTSSLSETTANPHDITRDPGGSSSGSGAAVAAGMAVAAIGGDTCGSIRLPSSFCGLVGVRPTPGRISRDGMSALVAPQDTPGPMARTVEDAAKIMDVIVGFDENDFYTSVNFTRRLSKSATPFQDAIKQSSLNSKRFGVLRDAFGSHEGINRVLDSTLTALQNAGVELIDVYIPDRERYVASTAAFITRSKADVNEFLASRKELAHLKIEELVAAGIYHRSLDMVDCFVKGPTIPSQSPHFATGLLAQAEFQRIVASTFARHQLDAMIYPTCQVLPPKTEDVLNHKTLALTFPTNTTIASQLHFPAVTVPVGRAKDADAGVNDPELPVGLEILGLPLCEEDLMANAAGVEAVSPFFRAYFN